MVALTGVEPANGQFGSVIWVYVVVFSVQLVFQDAPEYRHDVPTSQRSHSAVAGKGARAMQPMLRGMPHLTS